MYKPSNQTQLFIAALLAIVAIVISIRFVDKEMAIGIWAFTSSHPFLHKHFEHIPNTLPDVVTIGTATIWLAYYVVVCKKGSDKQAHFLQLAAIVVPIAYLIKIFLHYAFGRTNIRLWLQIGGPIEFNWFNPLHQSGGFPSGHAIVFTAFFTAVWLYYPRLRPLAVAVSAALAVALLFTSYHFLSDIIAGMCCGILITVSIQQFLSRIRTPKP